MMKYMYFQSHWYVKQTYEYLKVLKSRGSKRSPLSNLYLYQGKVGKEEVEMVDEVVEQITYIVGGPRPDEDDEEGVVVVGGELR